MVERISTRALAGRPSTRALGASIALTVALLLFLPQVARAGGAIELPAGSNHETDEAVRWGFVIAIGVELILSLGFQFVAKVDVAKLFVGTDNRVSTSKTIAAVWTFVVAAALFALVYANLLDHPGALEATNAGGRVGQYALLFGDPIGAAILSKAIVGGQVSSSSNAKTTAKSPALADLIANDSGESDLGDLQYVLFNERGDRDDRRAQARGPRSQLLGALRPGRQRSNRQIPGLQNGDRHADGEPDTGTGACGAPGAGVRRHRRRRRGRSGEVHDQRMTGPAAMAVSTTTIEPGSTYPRTPPPPPKRGQLASASSMSRSENGGSTCRMASPALSPSMVCH